jgi:hypothetical protein
MDRQTTSFNDFSIEAGTLLWVNEVKASIHTVHAKNKPSPVVSGMYQYVLVCIRGSYI